MKQLLNCLKLFKKEDKVLLIGNFLLSLGKFLLFLAIAILIIVLGIIVYKTRYVDIYVKAVNIEFHFTTGASL